MLPKLEVVYKERDNDVSVILKQNDSAVDLSGVTEMWLTVGKAVIKSTNDPTTNYILWDQAGYSTGEVRFYLGKATAVVEGLFEATLTLFDAGSTAGLVWDNNIPLWVRPDPHTT